jgi:glycosyltransferase involved in cell wall biosynthesis
MMPAGSAERPPRVLYVQYANPAAYPPLERSSRQFADAGWDVLFAGTESAHVGGLTLPAHDRISVRLLRGHHGRTGLRLKMHYLRFCVWATLLAVRFRPTLVYASDIMSAPIALLLKPLLPTRVVLHEHDVYEIGRPSWLMRLVMAAFARLARVADRNALPNEGRLQDFRRRTGAPADRCVRVWNCPARAEVRPPRAGTTPPGLKLLFHGAIVPARVPPALLDALRLLPDVVTLRVIGYESPGSRGYVAELRRHAERLQVQHRVEFIGPTSHHELLRLADDCDVGLACMPGGDADVNLRFMAGASNKAFEYLACGLPLLVSDRPDWRELFVTRGLARVCDVNDAASIAAALRAYLDDPEGRRRSGERGRQLILTEWNYEVQFAPVLAAVTGRREPLREVAHASVDC